MGRLKNTFVPNLYGDGYQQEYIDDNGDVYRIKNTFVPNLYGDGYQKEIIKEGNVHDGTPLTEKQKKDLFWYWLSATSGFMTLFSWMITEWSFFTWMFTITCVISGIYAFILKPSVVIDVIKTILIIAVIDGILLSPVIYYCMKLKKLKKW